MNLEEASVTALVLAWVLMVLLSVVVVRRLVAAMLFALGILPVLWGMALAANASSYEHHVFIPFLIGAAALLLGCAAASKRSESADSGNVDNAVVVWAYAAPCLVGVAIFGTALHFYLTGIPILGGDVEVQRFSSGSALGGFPSRMYQFGLPLSAAAALAQARSEGVLARTHNLTRMAFGAMVLAGVLSGFKSGLSAVVITGILLAAATGATMDVSPRAIVRMAAVVVISVVFAFWVANHYGTYAKRDIAAVLEDRILTGSADGPEAVLLARDSRRFGPSSVTTDAKYFAAKYFGITSGGSSFAFHEQVSSALTRTPLRRDRFLVPVTTTAIADALYDGGLLLGCVAMAALGYVLQRAQREATSATDRPYRFLAFAALLLGGYSYVIKGGLVYTLINWSLVYVLFAGICAATVSRAGEQPLTTGANARSGTVEDVPAVGDRCESYS